MKRAAVVVTALLILSACDAAVTAEARSDAPAEVQAEAAVAADAKVETAVVAEVEADARLRTGVVTDGKLTVSAEAFKLGEVTTLIQAGEIETAEELELAVNDPEADINTLDIDLDGKIDMVEVVEVRGDARVDFQMRVIPSSKASVEHAFELATASVVAARATSEVSFSASFSAGVAVSAGAEVEAQTFGFVAPASFTATAVVVTQPLLAWAFVTRPVYHSVFVEVGTGRWIPPGHLKHGLWKATGGLPPGHGGRGVGVGAHGKGGFEVGHGKDHGEAKGGKSGASSKGASKPASGGGSKHSASKSSGGGGGSASKGGGGSKGGSKGGSGGGSKGGSGGGGKGGSKGGGGGKGGEGK